MTIRQEIVDGCGWWLWATAYASACDEAQGEGNGRVPWGPGGSIDPFVPPVPRAVQKVARAIVRRIERRSRMTAEALMVQASAYEYADWKDAHSFGTRIGGWALADGSADFSHETRAILDGVGRMFVECVAESRDANRARLLYVTDPWHIDELLKAARERA